MSTRKIIRNGMRRTAELRGYRASAYVPIYGTRVFTEPVRVMVTTSGYDTDSVFMKKLKEREKELKEISEFIEKVKDEVIKTCGVPRSILDGEKPKCCGLRNIKEIDEMHEAPADDGWLEYATHPVRSGRYPWHMEKDILKYTKEDIEATTKMAERINMTVTKNPEYQFKIKRVLFNNPATIVFWADGDKTVVKCQNGEPYDPEKGLAMAISKKALGNDRNYYNTFAKQCKNKPSEVANKNDLKAAIEDNKTNRALAADALEYLSKAVNDPKATKVNLAYAMEKAIECVNAILDNY